MDDHGDAVESDDEADLGQGADSIGPDDQRESVIEIEDVNRIAIGMKHVLGGDTVLPSALGDDGLHESQVTLRPTGQQVNL